jgi:tellurite methyltransferase
MTNMYDDRYNREEYYWGNKPSGLALKVLKIFPPDENATLLEIGCGEGRNAVFFARNGYNVSAFDLSPNGVKKTDLLAERVGVTIRTFTDDIKSYRLDKLYDVLFSTGVLHYIPTDLRREILENYRDKTRPGGINAMSVLIKKPFIPSAPDSEATANLWISGELFTYYHDWRIEYSIEEIFDCTSGGKPHQHAVNRIIARKPGN